MHIQFSWVEQTGGSYSCWNIKSYMRLITNQVGKPKSQYMFYPFSMSLWITRLFTAFWNYGQKFNLRNVRQLQIEEEVYLDLWMIIQNMFPDGHRCDTTSWSEDHLWSHFSSEALFAKKEKKITLWAGWIQDENGNTLDRASIIPIQFLEKNVKDMFHNSHNWHHMYWICVVSTNVHLWWQLLAAKSERSSE